MTKISRELSTTPWPSKQSFITHLRAILGREETVTEGFAITARKISVDYFRMMQIDATLNGVQASYLTAGRKRRTSSCDATYSHERVIRRRTHECLRISHNNVSSHHDEQSSASSPSF